MDKDTIINDVKENGSAEIAVLQQKYNISYREAKAIIDELVAKGTLVFESGVKYSYVDTSLDENGKEPERHRAIHEKQGNDSKEDADEEKARAERRAYFEARRQEFLRQMAELDEDDDDEDEENIDKGGSAREKDFREEVSDGGIKEGRKENEAFDAILNRIIQSDTARKKEPIIADKVPLHPSWNNEDEFAQVVMERLERLVKSDRRMGHKGAVKKAETYLEAVSDTHDGKMVQVYERLVYEIKNTGNYLYGQLKKKFFGE